MARIELAPEVLQDFDRFLDHLAQFDDDVPGRIAEILEAIQILRNSPEIGRKIKAGMRELVIGHGAHGYVALYRFVPQIDVAFVLAIRAQREADYKPHRGPP